MKTNTSKIYRLLSTFLTITVLTTLFFSCKDDEGGDDDPLPTLTIASFTPATARIGESITITGTGFGKSPSLNAVTFKGATNSVDAPVTEATETTLKVTVPDGAQTGPITVKVGSNTVTSTASFTIDTSQGSPTLVSLNPTNGFINTQIVITGTNFGTNKSAVKVFFGATEVSEIIDLTATTITVKVPESLSPGEVDIKVKREDKESVSTLKFTVNKIPVSVKKVYWTSSEGIFSGAISETGVEIKKLYDVNNAKGIEADPVGKYLYWAQSGKVVRAPIEGGGTIETLYQTTGAAGSLFLVFDIVVDPATDVLCIQGAPVSGGKQYIMKGSAKGNTVAALTTLYTLTSADPKNIKMTLDNTKLYWTELKTKKVSAGDLNGTPEVVLFDETDGLAGPTGVAFDNNNNLYIADKNIDGSTNLCKIFKGKTDGSGSLTTLVEPGNDVFYPNDLEIDLENGYIFWMNQLGENSAANAIMRSTLNGESTEKLFDGFNYGLYFDLEIGE